MDGVCSNSSNSGTSTVTLDPSSYLTTPIITSYSAYTTQAISSRDSLILSTYSGLLSSTIPPLTLNTLTVNGGIFETTSFTTSNITDIAIQSSAVGTSFWLQPSKDIVSSNVDYSRTESVPSTIESENVNTKPGGITPIDKESTRSSDFLNSDIISYFQPFSRTDTLEILSSNSYTVTPERTSIFVTSDIYLFTESYSYNSNILSMNTLTSSNLSDGSKSEPVATSLSSISHYMSSTSLDYTSVTSLMSSASETLTSSSDILTHPIPTSSSLSLSSLSTTYNLPGILPTLTTGSSTLKTVHYSSEPTFSTISTDILHETSQNVVSSTVSSTWTLAQTTPVSEGVTSAFDKMSTSIFTTTARIGDLEKQVADLMEVQNKYMIAVIVLALIIAALITLIVLYVIRRRRYYEKKRLNPGGIDADLLNGSETNKRPKKKTYFNADHADSLRISGRISTASLGDNEPLNALKSFNKSKDKTEDIEEKRDKKLESINDESL